MDGQRIGEYQHVLNRTTREAALVHAHRIPISRGDALWLVKQLAARFEVEQPVVRFSSKKGRAGKRFLGADGRVRRGVRGEDLASGVARRVNYISLPGRILDVRDGEWYGYLRVGLVLHEFAHLLAMARGHTCAHHGPEFVQALDDVLDYFYGGE